MSVEKKKKKETKTLSLQCITVICSVRAKFEQPK